MQFKTISIVEIDLASSEEISRIDFSKLDLVLNFASESHVDRSISNPRDFATNNANLMINLLEMTRKQKGLPFVHLSTDEVYGSTPLGETNHEWQRVHLPSNPYSASKSAQESLAIAYFKTYNFPLYIINATNMLGEAQNQEKFIPKAIRRILAGESINIDTNIAGEIGTRKYLDVREVASTVWKASNALINNGNASKFINNSLPQKYHLSGREEITNLQVVEIFSEAVGKKAIYRISPSPRPGYELRYELTSQSLTQLEWSAGPGIRDRLVDVCKWTLKNPSWLYHDYSK